jgi:hypothetical protein
LADWQLNVLGAAYRDDRDDASLIEGWYNLFRPSAVWTSKIDNGLFPDLAPWQLGVASALHLISTSGGSANFMNVSQARVPIG